MIRIIVAILISLPFGLAHADPIQLSIKISGLSADKPHFLCLYGAGCYNMRSAENGKVFPLNAHVLPNLKKVFIADMRTKQLYGQPISDSCRNILANPAQTAPKLTLSGKLAVQGDGARIEGLKCELS